MAFALPSGPRLVAVSAAEPPAGRAPAAALRTTTVTRGDVVVTLGATGTLEPEEVVDVSAQAMGIVKKLGPDRRGKTDPRYQGKSIDYGSPVEEGDVLAHIDDATYATQVEQAQAGCARAEAELLQAPL